MPTGFASSKAAGWPRAGIGIFSISQNQNERTTEMSMEEEKDSPPGLEGAKTALRKTIVKAVMEDERNKTVIEEISGGGAGVFATHKITFREHELFAHSEEDAKFADTAITALNLVMAAKFAGELTGAAMKTE